MSSPDPSSPAIIPNLSYLSQPKIEDDLLPDEPLEGQIHSDPDVSSQAFIGQRKLTDIKWGIAFWVNLAATITLLVLSKPFEDTHFISGGVDFTLKEVLYIGVVSVIISFAYSLLSLVAMWFCPGVYVKGAIVIIFILLFACIIPLAIILSVLFVVIGVVVGAYISAFLKTTCGKIDYSSSVLKAAVQILHHYPSMFMFNLGMLLLQTAISYMFSIESVVIYTHSLSPWLYAYLIFSYAWISKTLTYVTFMTCSGVAYCWYFYGATSDIPQKPLLASFKHAIWSNFGTCANAGIVEGVIDAITSLGTDGVLSFVKCCCCCQNWCSNELSEWVENKFGTVNRHSLIIVGMNGTRPKEAGKIWRDLAQKDSMKNLTNSTVLSATFQFYAACAFLIGGAIGALASDLYFGDNSAEILFVMASAAICAYNGVLLVSGPMEIMSDTLFIVFCEYPNRVRESMEDIYDILDKKAKEIVKKDAKDDITKPGKDEDAEASKNEL